MSIDKVNFDKSKYNGYEFVGLEGKNKMVLLQKKEGKGYFRIKLKQSDFKDGNAEFMTLHGLSRK